MLNSFISPSISLLLSLLLPISYYSSWWWLEKLAMDNKKTTDDNESTQYHWKLNKCRIRIGVWLQFFCRMSNKIGLLYWTHYRCFLALFQCRQCDDTSSNNNNQHHHHHDDDDDDDNHCKITPLFLLSSGWETFFLLRRLVSFHEFRWWINRSGAFSVNNGVRI